MILYNYQINHPQHLEDKTMENVTIYTPDVKDSKETPELKDFWIDADVELPDEYYDLENNPISLPDLFLVAWLPVKYSENMNKHFYAMAEFDPVDRTWELNLDYDYAKIYGGATILAWMPLPGQFEFRK